MNLSKNSSGPRGDHGAKEVYKMPSAKGITTTAETVTVAAIAGCFIFKAAKKETVATQAPIANSHKMFTKELYQSWDVGAVNAPTEEAEAAENI
jgi:hypothetical protein